MSEAHPFAFTFFTAKRTRVTLPGVMPELRTPSRLRGFDYSRSRTYFLTFCVWDRFRVFSNPTAAGIACRHIEEYRLREWFWLLAFCVMPDHIHILIRLRRAGLRLDRLVASLKNRIQRSGRDLLIDFKWQPGFFDRVLREGDDPTKLAAYIVENPVRAGLVTVSRDYPYGRIVDRWF